MTQKWKTNQTTSKIYKVYINGKPKRPGTWQYPYLGPKVSVVGEKLDPTVRQICFRHIFQTVRNLRKGTTGMSSGGPKMGGERYGLTLNGQKIGKSDDPPWRPPPHSPARSGLVRRWFAVKLGGGIVWWWRSSLAGACSKWVAGDASHGQKRFGLKAVHKDPIRIHGFWRFF